MSRKLPSVGDMLDDPSQVIRNHTETTKGIAQLGEMGSYMIPKVGAAPALVFHWVGQYADKAERLETLKELLAQTDPKHYVSGKAIGDDELYAAASQHKWLRKELNFIDDCHGKETAGWLGDAALMPVGFVLGGLPGVALGMGAQFLCGDMAKETAQNLAGYDQDHNGESILPLVDNLRYRAAKVKGGVSAEEYFALAAIGSPAYDDIRKGAQRIRYERGKTDTMDAPITIQEMVQEHQQERAKNPRAKTALSEVMEQYEANVRKGLPMQYRMMGGFERYAKVMHQRRVDPFALVSGKYQRLTPEMVPQPETHAAAQHDEIGSEPVSHGLPRGVGRARDAELNLSA